MNILTIGRCRLFSIILILFEFSFLILLRHFVLGFWDAKGKKARGILSYVPFEHFMRNMVSSQKILPFSTQHGEVPYFSLVG